MAEEETRGLDEMVREGLERKRDETEARSHGGDANPREGMTDESGELLEPSRTQDEFSVRAKNVGKGKKTADKWNQ
jgi:hypothetical protein